jgi:uncharacterized protein YkwD
VVPGTTQVLTAPRVPPPEIEAENTESADVAFLEGEDLEETTETDTEEIESTQTEESEETEAEAAATGDSTDYTYTDMSATMYADSSVSVRDLPSTDGNKLGSLSANQEVTVTGQCNETSWYRIEYKNGVGYVSNKYLSEEEVAVQSSTGSTRSTGSSASAGTSDASASTGSTSTTSTSTAANGLDRSTAEAIWTKVNAERSAAGISTLAWDETAYSNACSRAQQIVSDFSHNGKYQYYGENIYNGSNGADVIHQAWHNSTDHYNNYMSTDYTSGACAVYLVDGYAYAVEVFVPSWYYSWSSSNSSSSSNETYTVNDAESAAAAGTSVAPEGSWTPTGTPWTASNGVTLYISENGSRIQAAPGTDTDAYNAAVNEYYGW